MAVRLIATDIDGTLIPDSTPTMYPEMIETIKRLTDRGIVFFVASGRAVNSIRTMFHEVADRIGYIAENGAHIMYQGENLGIRKMPEDSVEQLIRTFRELGPGYDYMASTPEGTVMEHPSEQFEALIRDGYRNQYRIVEDMLTEKCRIIKLALYHPEIRELGEQVFIPQWGSALKVCMAGEMWIDFMDRSVDKGNALIQVQQYLGISKGETMAFGDNDNDIGLVRAAGESYAVENAVPAVKAQAKYICPSYREKGVYQILRQL